MQLIPKRPNSFISWVLMMMITGSCLPSQAFAADPATIRKALQGCLVALTLVVPSHGQAPDNKPAAAPTQVPAVPAPAGEVATTPTPAPANPKATPATAEPAKTAVAVTPEEQEKLAKQRAEAAKTAEATKAVTKVNEADTAKPPAARPDSETLLKELETLGVTPERAAEIQAQFVKDYAKSMEEWNDENPKSPDTILLDSTAGAVSRSIMKWPFIQRQVLATGLFGLVIGPTMLVLLREKKLSVGRKLGGNQDIINYLKPTSDALDQAIETAIRSLTGGIPAEEKPGLIKRVKDEPSLTLAVKDAMIAAIEAKDVPAESDVPFVAPDEAMEQLRVATDAFRAALASDFVKDKIRDTGLPPLDPFKDWDEMEGGVHKTIVDATLGLDNSRRGLNDQFNDNKIKGTKILNRNLAPGEKSFIGDLLALSETVEGLTAESNQLAKDLGIEFRSLFTNVTWANAKTNAYKTRELVQKLCLWVINTDETKREVKKQMTALYRRIQLRNRLTAGVKRSWDIFLSESKGAVKISLAVTTQIPRAVWKLGTRRISTLLILAAFTGPPAYSLIDTAMTTAVTEQSADSELARLAELARANNAMLIDSSILTNDEQILKAVVTAWEGFDDGTDLTPWWTAHFRNRLRLKWNPTSEENKQNLTDIRYLHFKALKAQLDEWNSWRFVKADYWKGKKFEPALDVEHYKVLFEEIFREHGFIVGEMETRKRIIATLANDAANILYRAPREVRDRMIIYVPPSGPGPVDGGTVPIPDPNAPAAGTPAPTDPNPPTPPADPNAAPVGTPAPTPDPNPPPAGTPAPNPPAPPTEPPKGI